MKPISPLIVLSVLLAATPTLAEVTGCFGRSYSPEHLAANPGQQVRDIRAKRYTQPDGAVEYYDIRVHFRDDPREFTAATYCEDEGGRRACMIECDGGVVYPTLAEDGRLRLTTGYLRAETNQPLPGQTVEEGDCAAPITRSIADQKGQQNVRTVFLLQPRKLAECDWRDPS